MRKKHILDESPDAASQKHAREAARKQWLLELDEQRRAAQEAKKKDATERRKQILVYSSLFEAPSKRLLESQRDPGQTLDESSQNTSFFTGASAARLGATGTPRRRTLSEIQQMQQQQKLQETPAQQTTNSKSSKNMNTSKSNKSIEIQNGTKETYISLADQMESASLQNPDTLCNQQSFGRIRSQFSGNQCSDDAAEKRKLEAEAWRESLRLQVLEKKKREADEKAKPEFVYRSWGDSGHQSNTSTRDQGDESTRNITGGPMRRSADIIVQKSSRSNNKTCGESQYDDQHSVAPAAESQLSVIESSKLRLSVSKLPQPTPIKLAPIPAFDFEEPYLSTSSPNSPSRIPLPPPGLPSESPRRKPTQSNPQLESTQRAQESSETLRISTPRSPHKPPQSPSKKLAKILDTVHLQTIVTSPPPPSPPLPTSKKQFNSMKPSISPTRKLTKILGSLKGANGYLASQSERTRDIKPSKMVKKAPRVMSAFGRTVSGTAVVQQQQQEQIRHQLHDDDSRFNRNKKLPSIKSKSEFGAIRANANGDNSAPIRQLSKEPFESKHINREQHFQQTIQNPSRPQSPPIPTHSRKIDTVNTVPAAGSSTGRIHSRSEFTPQGSLRPPWGVDVSLFEPPRSDYAGSSSGFVRVNGKLQKSDDIVARPPWGIQADVPIRVLGRQRKVNVANEQTLKDETLNELTRFGSILEEEKRALQRAMLQ